MSKLIKQGKILFFLALLLASGLGVVVAARAVEVGEKASDFTLPSTTGEKISLSQFRGRKHILLEFYVADFGAT